MTCHKDARCEVQSGTQGCYCAQGYTGNGITFCYGKQILPVCISVMCLLEKNTQEPINSRIKLHGTTPYDSMLSMPKIKVFAVSEKFYRNSTASSYYFNMAYHASQLYMTCFPASVLVHYSSIEMLMYLL